MNKDAVKPRSIAVMVGLPHLADGKLLARARRLQQPVLISANALSRWSRKRGWREWAGWSMRQLDHAAGLHSLCLDSAGFSAMVSYGGYPWTVDDYVRLAAGFPFRWWASLDYCVEHALPQSLAGCLILPPSALDAFDVANSLTDSLDIFRIGVGYRDAECFFEDHDKLDDVETIGAQIINEMCLRDHFFPVHTELVCNHLAYPIGDVIHQHDLHEIRASPSLRMRRVGDP